MMAKKKARSKAAETAKAIGSKKATPKTAKKRTTVTGKKAKPKTKKSKAKPKAKSASKKTKLWRKLTAKWPMRMRPWMRKSTVPWLAHRQQGRRIVWQN